MGNGKQFTTRCYAVVGITELDSQASEKCIHANAKNLAAVAFSLEKVFDSCSIILLVALFFFLF